MIQQIVCRLFAFLVYSFLVASNALAQPTHNLIIQPRTMAMGGAGVGLADDEYALFNNSAGLAGNEKRTLKIVGLGLEGSGDIYTSYSDSRAAAKNFGIASLSKLMGKDIYMRGGLTPILRLKHFSIAYVVDGQFALNQYNQINPIFTLGAMTTQGVQAGFGYGLNRGKNSIDEIRFGIAPKILWRKGGYYQLSSADLLSATTSGDGNAYLNNIMGPYSMGIGADLGAQYVYHLNKISQISAGTNLTDIGGTKFGDPRSMAIPMDWALGVGFKTELTPFKLAVAFDYRNALTAESMTNRLHLGAEVGMPLFDLYAGFNQLYFTYGFAFDLWIMKVSLISYGEEQGINFQQAGSRRYLFQFDFKLPI